MPAQGGRSKKSRAAAAAAAAAASAAAGGSGGSISPMKPPGRTSGRSGSTSTADDGSKDDAREGSAAAGPSSTRSHRKAAYLYPSAAERPEDLTPAQQELKVARHSVCLAGQDDDEDESSAPSCGCIGLRPPKGSVVIAKPVKKKKARPKRKLGGVDLDADDDDTSVTDSKGDDERTQDGEEEEVESAAGEDGLPWTVCACGHEIGEHGRLAEEGAEERRRRIKVAVRLDELLEDEDKLLDWTYVNDDLLSLKKQMLPPGSSPEKVAQIVNGGGNRKRKSRSPGSDLSSALSSPSGSLAGSPDAKRRKLSLSGTGNGTANAAGTNGHAKDAASTNAQDDAGAEDGAGVGKRPAQGSRALADQAGDVATEQPQNGASKLPDIPRKDAAPIDLVAKGIAIDTAEIPAAMDVNDKTTTGDAKDAAQTTGEADDDESMDAPPPPKQPLAVGLDAGAAPRRERPAVIEERAGLIQFRVVENDGTPENMILLTGLKNIFQRQLPKMPREYITRLVLDRNHMSMAIVKRGLQVVGGITYRPFNHRKFAEIVFCAITGTEQVKGYGSHLMNHLKDHVRSTSPVMHFLTYADNYAIGYFKKQGFTKEISLDRAIWVGYIKDYEGGTLMQCSMVPRVKYLKVQELLAEQKAAVLAKIRENSKSHIVHPGLQIFKDRKPDDPPVELDPSDVPGLKESGWTPAMDELARRPKRGPHHSVMRQILVELNNHPAAWPFLNPVNGDEVVDYYDVIKEPMDLSTMEAKMENNQYDNLDDFLKDTQLIFDNCRKYNPSTSTYAKQANRLEKYLKDNLQAWRQAGGL